MTIPELYQLYQQHSTICTDTRNISTNALFFALKGENFNANLFAQDAINKGCAFAVVDDKTLSDNPKCIIVENVLDTLQKLANFHRKQLNIPFIGITGTNGKTTTKEIINAVLSKKYAVVATKGNLNNHIGVPLTILSVTKNTEIAIIEMGANHPGEIKELCNIADPDFGIITNIGKAHLEGFGSYEGVINTKNELYKFIAEKQGKLFVNNDNPLLVNLSEKTNRIFYGTNATNCFSNARICTSDTFLKVEIPIDKQWLAIKSNLVGSYNFENINAAICIGKYFKVSNELIKSAIEKYMPSNNRSQIIKTESNTIIMDAYNANPSSMEAALINFSQTALPDKILIIGDMRELGADAQAEHSKIISLIESLEFNSTIFVGEVFCALASKQHFCFPNSETAANWLNENKMKNKSILIKGSRGIQLEKVLKVL